MGLKLNTASGGSVSIEPTNTASNYTLTVPAITDTVTTTTTKIVSGTAVASTSGTSIDFTGIPSWAKRITVMFSGVSTNGSSGFLLQLGDAGGIENTGYVSGTVGIGNTVVGSLVTSTAGIVIAASFAAANTYHGIATINLIDANTYAVGGSAYNAASVNYVIAGSKTLSDTLTQIRITTINGTDTFDAGSINIMYE